MKPTLPTPEQIAEAYALAKAAWARAVPGDEFSSFDEWKALLEDAGLAAIVAFVQLARYGVN